MTTFELTDELLDAALRVDDHPLPAALRSAVRVAVAGSARPRVFVPQLMPRPALFFAILTALLAVALVVTAVWFGSQSTLKTELNAPVASASPSPRESDLSRTFTSPGVVPTPIPTPPETPSGDSRDVPWVLSITRPDGLDAPNTTFDEFLAHAADSLDAVKPVADHWYDSVPSLEAGIARAEWMNGWITGEEQWIRKHKADACFWTAYAQWLDIVNGTAYAFGKGDVIGQDDARAGYWGTVRSLLESYDPGRDATCPAVVSFNDFASHVAGSIAAFKLAERPWYVFVTSLDGADDAQRLWDWLSAERVWLGRYGPQPCYEASFDDWQIAVIDVARAMTQAAGVGPGLSPNPEFPRIWADAMPKVADFQPTDRGC